MELFTGDSGRIRTYAVVVFNRGDVLRKWRENSSLTTEELAKRAGVNKNVITRAENGKLGVREDSLRSILLALGKKQSDLERAVECYGGAGLDLDAELIADLTDAVKLRQVRAFLRLHPVMRQYIETHPDARPKPESVADATPVPPAVG